MVLCGLFAQLCHGLIMSSFPFVQFTSIPFIGSCIMLIVNHWLAFTYFSSVWYQFSEVRARNMKMLIFDKKNSLPQILAYFTLCLWVVPFALFVSLSANDNVLPTVNERSPLLSKFFWNYSWKFFFRKIFLFLNIYASISFYIILSAILSGNGINFFFVEVALFECFMCSRSMFFFVL